MTHPKFCLVLMVHNNEGTLINLLDSLAGIIETYVIVDNQEPSTDATIEQCQLVLSGQGIHGKFLNYDKPFHSGNKRTFAVQAAKGMAEYLLVLDADNTLEGFNPFLELTADSYLVKKKMADYEYYVISLLKGNLDWKYTGVIHEYPELATGEPFTQEKTGGIIHEPVKIMGEGTGQRSRRHYYRHALLLENELFNNPGLSLQLQYRYMYYLAQSYKDAAMYERALDAYQARVNMGGWEEEVFYCLLQIARLKNHLDHPRHEVLFAALRAWQYRPQRLEAAVFVMEIYMQEKLYSAAYSIGWLSKDRECNDLLLVERDAYDNLFPALMEELQQKVNLPA